jgi:hypothetical protein
VGLDCTICHVTPEQHKVAPRIHRPAKPAGREFCARCHGEDSQTEGALKIDVSSHGGRYLCWQCHYPHLPEER